MPMGAFSRHGCKTSLFRLHSFDDGIMNTVSFPMKWVALFLVLSLSTSCAWITGSTVREDVIVHVPPSTTVQDVVPGTMRPLNWTYTADSGFTKEYAIEPGKFKDRNAWITHYSLGAGFYGQWGRIEYRMLRFTSWDADYANANVGMTSHGLYFTTHIMF